ncbi:MAG TPA: glutamyl-tRNA reductase [Candidatus Saccharimonadales bacterium]|nr:glutamyl-tRNA reductase [Candidatus Saccharimonadales bacterium]
MILCVGLNYRTSPANFRESVALTPEEAGAALEALRRGRQREALILSTCNRTEFYTRGEAEDDPLVSVAQIVRGLKGVDLLLHADSTYVWRTEESVHHLFRVTSGLDSMVIGETEIAGQVRAAADLSARRGMTGAVLRRMVDSAMHCARRIRSETAMTAGSVSMASVAVGLAGKVLGSLASKKVLIVGAGDTCRIAALQLRDAGARDFRIVNRTLSRGQELAERVGGRAHGLDALARLLPEADLVFAATSSPEPLIGVEVMREALRARRGRSMVVVDLAVPRDVHPDVNRLANVFVYSTESVRSIVDDNLERRSREAPRAEAIAVEEAGRFLDWYRGLAIGPTMATVREHLEELRARELARYARKFAPEDLPKLEELTRSLVTKILRGPTMRLVKAQQDPRRGTELADAVRHLFDLESAPPAEPSDEDRNEG